MLFERRAVLTGAIGLFTAATLARPAIAGGQTISV